MSKGKKDKEQSVTKSSKYGMFIGTDGTRFSPNIIGYAPQGDLQIMLMTTQGERVFERVLNYRTKEYRDKVLSYFDRGYRTLDLREPEPELDDEPIEGQLL